MANLVSGAHLWRRLVAISTMMTRVPSWKNAVQHNERTRRMFYDAVDWIPVMRSIQYGVQSKPLAKKLVQTYVQQSWSWSYMALGEWPAESLMEECRRICMGIRRWYVYVLWGYGLSPVEMEPKCCCVVVEIWYCSSETLKNHLWTNVQIRP